MSRKVDLTGMRFGRLTAEEPTENRENGYTIWICRCDCGNRVHASSRYLKRGLVTSCGCEQKKMRCEDLTGKRFGRLRVVSIAGERNEYNRVMWNCVCDCGNTVTVPSGQLKYGYRRSCGCLRRPPLKDWIGKQFGELTVISYDGKRNQKHYWKCRCSCGNEVSVCQSSLLGGHTASCGCRNMPFTAKHFVEGTCLESIRSRRIASNNTSGVRGVYKSERSGKWCAQITFQGKTRYLGSFSTLEEAAEARRKGEILFSDLLVRYDTDNGDQKSRKIQPEEICAQNRHIVQMLHSEVGIRKISV